MLCDFYELTMGYGYFEKGYRDRICYFDVFFRQCPDGGGFAIAAGLEQIIQYIQDLHFDPEDIAYLRERNLFCEEFLEYLANFKNTNFVKTYYFADEGVCTVNFAHKEGATVCYPDLIKVGVALDTGEIMLVEAGGYIANHTKRTITTPKYSVNEAREKLSPALKINSAKRCIIPTSGNMEKHCYEFDCIGLDNEEILVYVNVENLEEERILLVVKTDGGTLTK